MAQLAQLAMDWHKIGIIGWVLRCSRIGTELTIDGLNINCLCIGIELAVF